ncbi:MAG: DUF1566 domain-containing protein [Magnetococcus sp. DMHC-6]
MKNHSKTVWILIISITLLIFESFIPSIANSEEDKSQTRFVDNGDGTITDTMIGLIGLKNANCFGEKNWEEAISTAALLASGACGLSDGSKPGDWRLASKDELPILITWQKSGKFTNIQDSDYWSSTTAEEHGALRAKKSTSKPWGMNPPDPLFFLSIKRKGWGELGGGSPPPQGLDFYFSDT